MNFSLDIESKDSILDTYPLFDKSEKPYLLKAGCYFNTTIKEPKLVNLKKLREEMQQICGKDTNITSIEYSLKCVENKETNTENVCKKIFDILVTLPSEQCMLVYLPETFTHLSMSVIYFLRSRAFSRCLLYRPTCVRDFGTGSFLLCAQYRVQSTEQLEKLQQINTISEGENVHMFFDIPNNEYHNYYNKFMNAVKIYNYKVRNIERFTGRKRNRHQTTYSYKRK